MWVAHETLLVVHQVAQACLESHFTQTAREGTTAIFCCSLHTFDYYLTAGCLQLHNLALKQKRRDHIDTDSLC